MVASRTSARVDAICEYVFRQVNKHFDATVKITHYVFEVFYAFFYKGTDRAKAGTIIQNRPARPSVDALMSILKLLFRLISYLIIPGP